MKELRAHGSFYTPTSYTIPYVVFLSYILTHAIH